MSTYSSRKKPDHPQTQAIGLRTYENIRLAVGAAAYAQACLDRAADALFRARESSVDQVAAIAGFNLGVVLGALQRFEEEVKVYDEVVERFGDATEPALREQVATALFNKAVRLGTLEASRRRSRSMTRSLSASATRPSPRRANGSQWRWSSNCQMLWMRQ